MDNNILFSNLSLCDSENRVFQLNNIFYRGVFKKNSAVVKFLESDLYIELYELGYVPKTTIATIENGDFELILKHETAPFITYPHEWSFEMLKDSCLLYLKIVAIAQKHNYILKDGQPYNIVYFDNKPKFVDIGSFIKSEKKINLDEFNRTMLLPLLIWSKGYYNVALNILSDDRAKLSLKDGMKLYFGVLFYGKPSFSTFKKMYRFIKTEKTLIKNSDVISKTNFISNIKVKENKTKWGNYHTEYLDETQIKSTERFDKIISYIDQYDDIKTVYDVACNQGAVSKLISSKCLNVEKIIATDYDENAIDNCYKTLNNYSNITTGISDLVCPISNFQEKSIQERYSVDCVLALALTHHLILGQKFHVDVIISRLKNLTKKYLFVEFMPLGLWDGISEKHPEVPEFYNIDWFTENISKYFTILKIDELETNRVLIICKIK